MALGNRSSLSEISFGPKNIPSFGTTPSEFKLWVDYLYEPFGATLEHRFRRYMVAASFASVIWCCGLAIVTPFGLAITWVTSPGIYFFWIGIAWCSNSLRWLSQTYHVRTNIVRPCFLISDQQYKQVVTPYARRATNNRVVFAWSAAFSLPVFAYVAALLLTTPHFGQVLAVAFPHSLPPIWRSGSAIIPKMVALDLLFTVAVLHVYTGAHLTRVTAPLYSRLAELPVIPAPALVSELFRGVIDLYQSGAFMWSFGIVLTEMLYIAELDVLSLAFIGVVVAFGLMALLAPRRAVRRIWLRSKEAAIEHAISEFLAKPLTIRRATRLNQAIDLLAKDTAEKWKVRDITSLAASQLLPVAPLLLNSLTKVHGLL